MATHRKPYPQSSPTRSTPSGARITVVLREGAEYEVSRENGLTVVSIQIPQEILAKREAGSGKGSI